MKNAGVTGSRKGLSREQRFVASGLLAVLDEDAVVHHGDCEGADEDLHYLAGDHGFLRHSHPPDNPKNRAFCEAEVVHDERPYLDRNKDIVNASDIMFAFPAEYAEVSRSGTWATIRYARKVKKPLVIVFPDGSTRRDV